MYNLLICFMQEVGGLFCYLLWLRVMQSYYWALMNGCGWRLCKVMCGGNDVRRGCMTDVMDVCRD